VTRPAPPAWWRAPLARLGTWREQRALARRAIPDDLWTLTLQRLPFLARLGDDDRAELRRLCSLFLDRKQFHGAGGLEVTDEMALLIAAQACLPVLRLGLHFYDGFVGIVVHPDEVVAQRSVMDEDGVVHEYEENLTGEAMSGGPLMLAWADVQDAAEAADWGYNVVIHEFAHVIDMRAGITFDAEATADRSTARGRWLRSLFLEHERFARRADRDDETFLDPYAAESLEEFFAVGSEAFFVAPATLKTEQPRLYRLLAEFYRQDPERDRMEQGGHEAPLKTAKRET